MKSIIGTIIFLLSFHALAMNQSQLYRKLNKLSFTQQKELIKELQKFYIKMEINGPKITPIKTSFLKSLNLIPQAYAEAVGDKEFCIYGGMISIMVDNYCTHPLRAENHGSKYKFLSDRYRNLCSQIPAAQKLCDKPTSVTGSPLNVCNPYLFGFERKKFGGPAKVSSKNCAKEFLVNEDLNARSIVDRLRSDNVKESKEALEELQFLMQSVLGLCLCQNGTKTLNFPSSYLTSDDLKKFSPAPQWSKTYQQRELYGKQTCHSLLSHLNDLLVDENVGCVVQTQNEIQINDIQQILDGLELSSLILPDSDSSELSTAQSELFKSKIGQADLQNKCDDFANLSLSLNTIAESTTAAPDIATQPTEIVTDSTTSTSDYQLTVTRGTDCDSESKACTFTEIKVVQPAQGAEVDLATLEAVPGAQITYRYSGDQTTTDATPESTPAPQEPTELEQQQQAMEDAVTEQSGTSTPTEETATAPTPVVEKPIPESGSVSFDKQTENSSVTFYATIQGTTLSNEQSIPAIGGKQNSGNDCEAKLVAEDAVCANEANQDMPTCSVLVKESGDCDEATFESKLTYKVVVTDKNSKEKESDKSGEMTLGEKKEGFPRDQSGANYTLKITGTKRESGDTESVDVVIPGLRGGNVGPAIIVPGQR